MIAVCFRCKEHVSKVGQLRKLYGYARKVKFCKKCIKIKNIEKRFGPQNLKTGHVL